jgi:hypothetical protein
MTKLLTEPRIIKKIDDVKTKKRKKAEYTSERVCIKHTILYESDKDSVNELIRVYKEDPFKARVKFFNSGTHSCSFDRLVLFEFDNGDFQICSFTNRFGISITNKMYSTQKKNLSIIYKNNKLWFTDGKVRPLCHNNLVSFISSQENIFGGIDKIKAESVIYKFFMGRFHWFRTVSENYVTYSISFNKVITDKLFSLNDMVKVSLGVNNKIANIIISSENVGNLIRYNSVKFWKSLIPYMHNLNFLTVEMLDSNYFVDTCRMAKTLGRKVNCKWSLRRLKEEHDNWAKEITRIVLECETEYDLKIKDIYKKFADYSGFKLLRTNKDMLAEGMIQNHCVGTYIKKVQDGKCAIFHIEGCTMEAIVQNINGKVRLYNYQFRGRYNSSAPDVLNDMVNGVIERFNNDYSAELNDEYYFVNNLEVMGHGVNQANNDIWQIDELF